VLSACPGGTDACIHQWMRCDRRMLAVRVVPDKSAPVARPAEAQCSLTVADGRSCTMKLIGGRNSLRVAFLDNHAAIVGLDGVTTIELPKREPSATSEPGVMTCTDGKQAFATPGGGDSTPPVRHALARVAFQDCAIEQN